MATLSKNSLLRGTAVTILATVILYGCKDFLSSASEPQGTLNQSTLANRAGVEGSLIASYRPLDCMGSSGGGWGCAASNWVWGSVTSDDSYKGSDGLDQPPINDIEGYHWGTGNAGDYLNTKWVQVYEGVVRSNSTLRLLAQVVASSPGEFSVADKNGIAGEAIFLRAYYHFDAYRMWGNIPYYREDDEDFRKPNIDSTQVTAEIMKDLDSAIKLLPTSPRNGQKGRADQWTAKAYKGRLQAYTHQWAAAVTTFKDIQANGPYALETSSNRVWSAFADAANGPETIFAFQASSQDGEPNANNSNFGERLNFPYNPSHFQCCGFDPPSQNLVNAFRVDPVSGLPLSITNPANWNASDAAFVAGNIAPVDPRLDWTVGRDGVPFKDWGMYIIAWVRDPSNGGPYMPKKIIHENAAGAEATVGWQPQQQSSINIHLYRYADLLLNLAEAEVETGDLAGATAIVNQIRTRATVAVQGCGKGNDATSQAALVAKYPQCATDNRMAVPMNDPAVTWATYKVGLYPVFPDVNYARQAVQTERRLELAMEGQRFFDLRRYGTLIPVITGYLRGVGGGREDTRRTYKVAAEVPTARHRWYPIPNNQIDLTKKGGESPLTQNTGW
jgi:hypothetical protein